MCYSPHGYHLIGAGLRLSLSLFTSHPVILNPRESSCLAKEMVVRAVLRPHVSAGVAVIGASLIAVAPALAPDVEQARQHAVAGGSVDLTAYDTYETYPVVGLDTFLMETFTNLQSLANEWLANPFPLLGQFAANLLDYEQILTTGVADSLTQGLIPFWEGLPAAVQYALDLPYGDFFNGLTYVSNYIIVDGLENTITPPLAAVQTVLQDIAVHLSNVANDTAAYQDLLMAPLYGPNAALTGLAGVTADFLAGWNTGNAGEVLYSLVNAPITVLNAFFNGYSPVDCGSCTIPPEWGFLTTPSPTAVNDPGTVSSIMEALRLYAKDIGPERAIENAKEAMDSAVLAHTEGLTNISQLGTEVGAGVQALGTQVQTAMADLMAALDAGSLATLVNPGDLAGLVDPALFTEIPGLLLNLIP